MKWQSLIYFYGFILFIDDSLSTSAFSGIHMSLLNILPLLNTLGEVISFFSVFAGWQRNFWELLQEAEEETGKASTAATG